MKTTLSSVLEVAALATGVLFSPACGDDDGGDSGGESADSTGSQSGCPGTTAGCPGTTAGCPAPASDSGSSAGCPAATAGCPGATAGCPGATAGCPGATSDTDSERPEQVEAVLALLDGMEYADWAAESAIHEGVGSSADAHGRVRTYFNEALVTSFEAENDAHPVGAAAIKELYDEEDQRIGWAVMVKIAEGSGGGTWHWYVQQGETVAVDDTNVELCIGCHDAGEDQILTAYPLP